MELTAKDIQELQDFGRTLFETADNTAMLLPALNTMLTAGQYDEIFIITQCSFINSHYYGVKYNSNLYDSTIEERYFDRFIEIVTGLDIAVKTYMPLLFHVINPALTSPVANWRRPATEYFFKIAERDYDLALSLLEELAPREMYLYDVLMRASTDRTVQHLKEQMAGANIGELKRIHSYLKINAPGELPARQEKEVKRHDKNIELKDADDLIEYCRANRDPSTVKRIKAALKFIANDDLAAMADYLLGDFDPASKKTAYLSVFFIKYGSKAVKDLLSVSVDTTREKRYHALLDAMEMDVEDIIDGKVDDYDLSEDFKRCFRIEDFDLFVAVGDGLTVEMQDAKGNSFSFAEGTVPRRFRLIKNHIVKYMKSLSAELKLQTDRMYKAFRFFRKWSEENFTANILGNPVLRAVASEFFWGEYRGEKLTNVFFIQDGLLFDIFNSPYDFGGGEIALAHPVDFENKYAHLKRLEMAQPFDQLRRSVFYPANEELGRNVTRFKGTVTKSGDLLKKLKKNGWRMTKKFHDGSYGAAAKNFAGCECSLEFQNLYPDKNELITVGMLKLGDAGRRLYSEILFEVFQIVTDNE